VLNKVILMGRLCHDPELKQTTSGISVCRIRIAVNRPYKKDAEQQADFITISCWRQTAEFVARYFSKGKMIIVDGSLRNNDYTDQNGVKHYSMEVLANNVSFGESKGSGSDAGQAAQTPQFGSVAAPASNPIEGLSEYEEVLSDGEVPF
jgi:single-strand DNA-binding protein